MRKWAIRALAVWAASLPLLTAAAAERPISWLLSYEVLSSRHAVTPAPRYGDKDKLASGALARSVRPVLAELGLAATEVRSRVRPGGYKDEVNPAIQTEVTATEYQADRIAAAMGYVFEQWAVLVADLKPEWAETTYISVQFGRGALSPAHADLFFAQARRRLASGKLGFSSLGDQMIFLNIDTGIDDGCFAAGLSRAAGDLRRISVLVTGPHPARARLIENDWDRATDGEDYARMIGDAALTATLRRLRDLHRAAVRKLAEGLIMVPSR